MQINNKTKIRWIVSDMDGTLLNPNHEITELTKQTLMECQRRGLTLILASGRSHTRMVRYAKELKMADYGGYFIEVNGMAIMEVASCDRTIFQRLKSDEIKELFQSIKNRDMEFQGYQDAALYNYIPAKLYEDKRKYRIEHNLPDDYPWTSGDWHMVLDLRDGYRDTYQVADVSDLPEQLNKISACHHPEILDQYMQEFKDAYQNKFEVTRTTPRCLEFTPKGIAKGNALRMLMEKFQVSSDEVIVFGDGENDLSMFDLVKHSIAMGSAPESIRKKASAVTLGNQEDGIAVALKKYVLID